MGILIIGYEVIVYLLLLICYTVEELNSLEQRTEKDSVIYKFILYTVKVYVIRSHNFIFFFISKSKIKRCYYDYYFFVHVIDIMLLSLFLPFN
jgi:hypothetical protein